MPESKSSHITGHSQQADEIFGRLPSWIIRWGITVLASILLAIIVACYIIKYPQTLTSDISLTSDNPPSDLVSRYSGILDSVYVSDGAVVESGDLIALIASPTSYPDLQKVEGLLHQMEDSLSITDVLAAVQLQGMQLGDLQSEWISLQRVCIDYWNWRDLNQAGRKIAMLGAQAEESDMYAMIIERERTNLLDNIRYGEIALRRDSLLQASGTLSEAAYEQSIISLHEKENELTDLDASLSNARLNRLALQNQILDLRLESASEELTYQQDIRRGVRQLLAEIAIWKETYALIAPFPGCVSLQNVWSRGQHINVGELVASITRSENSHISGRLKVPSSGFGKVKEGQRVIVRLNGYPYMEFGVLSGIVKSISSVPEQTSEGLMYTVTVDFPSGMETTYHRTLPFVQQMDGRAEIVTEDMRLIEQFIRPIRSLFVNH